MYKVKVKYRDGSVFRHESHSPDLADNYFDVWSFDSHLVLVSLTEVDDHDDVWSKRSIRRVRLLRRK
jgi:hypothetical protein